MLNPQDFGLRPTFPAESLSASQEFVRIVFFFAYNFSMARLLWTLKRRSGPAARVRHAVVFDEERRRVVLFGGGTDEQGPFFGDTWEWDGENWTQLDDIGPDPRWRLAMAYDTARHRTVLFGGQGPDDFSDTWEWDGEDWTQVADGGPSARHSHAMTFDSTRNRTVLFGGAAGATLLNDTWEWDGEEWVQVEDTGPAVRRQHAMAFDRSRGRVVLFGGTGAAEPLVDTWEWDGSAWTQTATFGPPAAAAAAMAGTANRVLLFGGLPQPPDGTAPFRNTWEWDGRHWTIRQDMGPAARWGHAMAWDTPRRRTVLFGGASSTAAQAVAPLGDTWEQFERGETGPPPPPPGPVTLQSLVITPSPVEEGRAFTIEARLSGPAPEAVTIVVTNTDADPTTPLELEFGVAAGQNSSSTQFFGGLVPGTYTFTAQFGGTERAAQVEIVRHSTLTLTALEANPNTVAPGQTFELRATLSGPVVGEDLNVPTRVRVDEEGPLGLFFAVPVPSGATSGTVTSQPFDPPGPPSVTIIGTLGGVERSVTVTFTQ